MVRWQDDPKIQAAKRIADEFGYQQVIWFGVMPDGETVERCSYGAGKKLCDEAGEWLTELWKAFCKIVSG